MGGALETATRQLFDSVDRKDAKAIMQAATEDIQSVDEISRRWLRGVEEFGDYIRHTITIVDDVHTTVSDAHEIELGETGVLTCWVEQDYTLQGKRQHVSAPTTLVLRRVDGAWKFLLFHSLPLPPEQA